MRYLRRIMLALALAVSATMLIPATAAQAGPGWAKLCVPGWVWVGDVRVWSVCATEIDVYIHEEIPFPCPPSCGPMHRFWDDKIDWDMQFDYFEQWDLGIETLAASRIAKDPQLAQELRFKATEYLLAAAELRKGLAVELAGVAWVDPESGKIYEGDDQLLWAVGKDLLAGQQLMMEAVDNPKAVAPAMEAYDSALTQLGNKAAFEN
jgi:hypothetical protein